MGLYDHDLTGAKWARPCGGNTGDSDTDESCIETTSLPGGGVAMRDSKRPDRPELRFTADEVDAFVKAYGRD